MSCERSALACWIEAMRLRTLPVSVAGVVYAAGLGVATWRFSLVPALMALAFAVLAQIASNFANEYFDFRDGLDKAGREGPRRGVTEGDISPRAMLAATFATLAVACVLGVVLVALYGSVWMYAVGVATALGAIAYSAGPYPLSRHGLGEVAVICFFGIIPVCFTYMLMGGPWAWWLLAASAGIGLMGANVLIVNNYRDREEDRLVGKRTLAVRYGPMAIASLYVANGFMAVILTLPAWMATMWAGWIPPLVYIVVHLILSKRLVSLKGRALNPLLGMTAMLMLAYTVSFLIFAILSQ